MSNDYINITRFLQELNSARDEVVLAIKKADGDFKIIQTVKEWRGGKKSTEILALEFGESLIDLLHHELNLLSLDEKGLLRLGVLVINNEVDAHRYGMKLIGSIAEALIVRSCNDEVLTNRRWAKYASRSLTYTHHFDRYKSIGTGLRSTELYHPTKYNPGDTQRDIIWVKKEDVISQLLMAKYSKFRDITAGLQVKVSNDGLNYLKEDLLTDRYEVPLVYFDFNNDYHRLLDFIHKNKPDIDLETDFLRGRDIDSAMHDELKYYWSLLSDLIRGKITLDYLLRITTENHPITEALSRAGHPNSSGIIVL